MLELLDHSIFEYAKDSFEPYLITTNPSVSSLEPCPADRNCKAANTWSEVHMTGFPSFTV
jgi:hypothetical protein